MSLACSELKFKCQLFRLRNLHERSLHLNFVFLQYGGKVKRKTTLLFRLGVFNKIRMFTAVILENKLKLVVPSVWCKTIDKNFALIFHSQNKDTTPDFENIHHNFHVKEDRTYYGFVLNDFGECSKLGFHFVSFWFYELDKYLF